MLHTAILSKKLLAFLAAKLLAIAIGIAVIPVIIEFIIPEAYSIGILRIASIEHIRNI